MDLNTARGMGIWELRRTDHPIARQQLELRERGERTVRGVLRHVLQLSDPAATGYGGTDGWHVTAYVTPECRIGLVNLAHGHAVLTDAQLEPEVIEALTVPEQREGVQASGAAAWSGGMDVGLAPLVTDSDGVSRLGPPERGPKSAEAPRGWVQLVLDLRGTAEPVATSAHVCAWGLRTCYEGRRGEPGLQDLERYGTSGSRVHAHPTLHPDEWPITAEQRARMHEIGQPIMQRIVLELADRAGLRAEMEAALRTSRAAAWQVATEPIGSHGYTAAGALRSVVSAITDVQGKALDRAGVTALCRLAGDARRIQGHRLWDFAQLLLTRILRHDLLPTAESLWSSLEPRLATIEAGRARDWWLHQHAVGPMLEQLAPGVADLILRDVVRHHTSRGNLDAQACYDALYAEGYVEVVVPIRRREIQ